MVSGSDSALLYALAAWFLFIALGKLKQLLDLSLSPPFSPFLSPFLLLVEMLWYREEQGRIQEKGRDRMGGKEKGRATETKKGREAEVQEQIFKAVPVLGATAASPPAHIPQPVSSASWLSCASTLAGLGSKPQWLCQGIIIPILWLLSPAGSFFSSGPNPKACTQVPLCSPPIQLLVPPNCHLLQSPLHCHRGQDFTPLGASASPSPFPPPPTSLRLGSPFLV